MSARRPTRQQSQAEQALRDLGVTVTFSPAVGVPHDHREYVEGCFRCEMRESAERINTPTRQETSDD